jgi:large conductance mechanosensitive channel
MHGFISEFKAFAMRGNVVDLAVAVVIGAAFGKIVSSLVDNIFTPVIGAVLGGIDFTGLTATMAGVTVSYGKFIQSVFDFVIVALVIFMVVKAMTKMQKKEEEKPTAPAEPSEEVKLLREIRDAVKHSH